MLWSVRGRSRRLFPVSDTAVAQPTKTRMAVATQGPALEERGEPTGKRPRGRRKQGHGGWGRRAKPENLVVLAEVREDVDDVGEGRDHPPPSLNERLVLGVSVHSFAALSA